MPLTSPSILDCVCSRLIARRYSALAADPPLGLDPAFLTGKSKAEPNGIRKFAPPEAACAGKSTACPLRLSLFVDFVVSCSL